MQTPTNVTPIIHANGKGINDQISPVKLTPGVLPFALNIDPESNVLDRRHGRDFGELYTGMALGIFNLTWEDGTIHVVGQIGSVMYNFSTDFDYLFGSGIRWLQQSPDLNWWDLTPDPVTGAISPTTVTFSGTALTSDLLVTRYQLFGFQGTGVIWRVRPDVFTGSLIREPYGIGTGLTTYAADRAFATGYGITLTDLNGDKWKYEVDNSGIVTKTPV